MGGLAQKSLNWKSDRVRVVDRGSGRQDGRRCSLVVPASRERWRGLDRSKPALGASYLRLEKPLFQAVGAAL